MSISNVHFTFSKSHVVTSSAGTTCCMPPKIQAFAIMWIERGVKTSKDAHCPNKQDHRRDANWRNYMHIRNSCLTNLFKVLSEAARNIKEAF